METTTAQAYLVGFIKGLFLLPIVVPWMVLSVLYTNVASLSVWFNHGYFAIRLCVKSGAPPPPTHCASPL